MKKKYLTGVFATLFAATTILSCSSDDPNIKHSATESIAGEWFVTYSVDGTDVNGGYSGIITSNTSANVATEMLITDYVVPNATSGNFWSYKIKAQLDPKTNKFIANESVSSALYHDEPYGIKVNELNVGVFKNGGKSKTGVTVDSIYFELQFEDDDPSFGTTYVVSGHKRTGFAADEF